MLNPIILMPLIYHMGAWMLDRTNLGYAAKTRRIEEIEEDEPKRQRTDPVQTRKMTQMEAGESSRATKKKLKEQSDATAQWTGILAERKAEIATAESR